MIKIKTILTNIGRKNCKALHLFVKEFDYSFGNPYLNKILTHKIDIKYF